MLNKKALIIAVAAMFSLPAFASVGEVENGVENGNDYGTDQQELDNDLQTSLGMTVNTYADGHKEVQDANGNLYSYQLLAGGTATQTCATGQTVCYRDTGDGTGSIELDYNTGRRELAVPGSHNSTELSLHAGQLGYSVMSVTNGVSTVRNSADGSQIRVRYSSQLVRGAAGVAPGIRVQNGLIIERYSDGYEQQIVPVM